jgi:signal transduction histidine kinase
LNRNHLVYLGENLDVISPTTEESSGVFYFLKEIILNFKFEENKTYLAETTQFEFAYSFIKSQLGLIMFINEKRLGGIGSSVTQDKFYFLGEMCANIIHDINNPLNVVIASHELIKFELEEDLPVDNKKLQGYLKNSEQGLTLITNIIDGVLSFCRQSQNQMKQVNISDVLVKTSAFFKTSFQKNGIRVDLKVENEAELNTYCFDTLLTQVVANLLKNSVEAVSQESPLNRWIELSASKRGESIVISVKDGGKIDPQVLNEIFNPLFTTKGAGSGTGLGLSFCKRIIDAHNGHISVNTENYNTTFDIVIPLKVSP